MILLHLYPKNLKLNPQQSTFIEYAILQAKRMIALSWKKPDPPVIGTWLKAMMQCMAMEKITYFIKNKMSVYEEIWKPFNYYINNNNIGHLLQEM